MKALTSYRKRRSRRYLHAEEYSLYHFGLRNTQLLIFCLCLIPHHLAHREHKWSEVVLSLKASFNIFPILTLIVTRQDFVWVYPIIWWCVCTNITNAKYTNTSRSPQDDTYHISMEVRDNLYFLRIWITHCAPSLAIPPSIGRLILWCLNPWILVSLVNTDGVYTVPHISAHYLFMKLCWIPTSPPPIVTARVIHYKWVAGAITYQGGVLEGHIKAPPQVNPEIIPG